VQPRSTVGATRRNGLSTVDISKQLIIWSVNDKINTSRNLVHVHTEGARSPVTHFYSSLNEAIFHMNLSFIVVQKKKKSLRVEEAEPPLHSSTGEQTITQFGRVALSTKYIYEQLFLTM
jgi:archaellin